MTETKPRFAYFKHIAIGAGSGAVALALIITGFTISGGPKAAPTNSASSSNPASAKPSTSASSTEAGSCLVTKQETDARLGELHAAVVNSETGELLFDRLSDQPATPASMLKILTATAALQTLGPNYRVETKVYQDPTDPGTIIIVGAGDPTLSRTAAGKQSVYVDAPKLSDLAIQVKAAVKDTPITQIITDSTLFTGPKWLDSWERSEQTIGYMSEVTALQVDGDRKVAGKETSPRSTDPVLRAGQWFRDALGANAAGAPVNEGVLPEGAIQIAKVSSQPISKWITHMMAVSDNTQAEALARLVSLELGFDGSFASLNQAIPKALRNAGADPTLLTIMDGSGLSNLNRVSPMFMTKLIQVLITASGDISGVKASLPVAGETGSLAARFKGKNVDAAGHIFAKTGWIKKGYTLGGFMYAKDGSTLVFSIYALGKVKDDAKDAIDNLATAIYRCGNTLSNN
jgi:D-alanyl-D-alanine carboxypeptidase/D-alanyl-D-alanine-endopeptidase (penicillin-binding protein 4)